MDATRPISSIISLPPKREDNGAYMVGRKNAASRQDPVRIDAEQGLSAKRQHAQAQTAIARKTAVVPVDLRDIQQTFVSPREPADRLHTPYSAQFLTQQLSQQDEADLPHDPAHTHRQAAAAYDNNLGLTATVIGFAGRAERIA